jgi:hypothetical protein
VSFKSLEHASMAELAKSENITVKLLEQVKIGESES